MSKSFCDAGRSEQAGNDEIGGSEDDSVEENERVDLKLTLRAKSRIEQTQESGMNEGVIDHFLNLGIMG